MRQMTHDRRPAGFGWAVLSASAFGLSGALGRGLMDSGWSSGAAVLARVLVGAVVLVPPALSRLRGRWYALRRGLPLICAYGIVAVAGCQLAYFNAVAHLPVGVALLIEYTAPVLVVGWLWARHGQRPGRLTVIGAGVAATGLVLVLNLTSGPGVDAAGVAWACAATAGAAVYFVLSARTDDGLPPVVLAASGLLVGGVVLALAGLAGVVPLVARAGPVVFGTGPGVVVPFWVPVLALGVVSAAVAYVSGIAATRRLGSRLASFMALLELVAAMVAAALLLGQLPLPLQLAGGTLVLAGIVVVKLGEPVVARAAVDEPERPQISVVGTSEVDGRSPVGEISPR